MIKFNDLVLIERIAQGGMAEVYWAKQIGYAGFEKSVALKRILPHVANSQEFKKMFHYEANLSAMLQHTNIAQVFSSGESQNYIYIVMEFIDGKNLRQLFDYANSMNLEIPIECSCYIICETLKGLNFAHNFLNDKTGEPLDIIHRDVSPQNIMISYDGSVKIVDFGIAKAKISTETTQAGILKGKYSYMSPEQTKSKTLDRRSDIFSAGIVLWELLAQQRLFASETDIDTIENVRACEVPSLVKINPKIPKALDLIVAKSLAQNPSERYPTCKEFYADLTRYMNEYHPHFLSTYLSDFLKTIFSSEIAETKIRRENKNRELAQFLSDTHVEKPQNSITYEQTIIQPSKHNAQEPYSEPIQQNTNTHSNISVLLNIDEPSNSISQVKKIIRKVRKIKKA